MSATSDAQREVIDAGLAHRVHYVRHGDVYAFAGRATRPTNAVAADVR